MPRLVGRWISFSVMRESHGPADLSSNPNPYILLLKGVSLEEIDSILSYIALINTNGDYLAGYSQDREEEPVLPPEPPAFEREGYGEDIRSDQ